MNIPTKSFDKSYWDSRYAEEKTGWDIGYASTPLKEYIEQLSDKNLKILIPGCGNAYEAELLIENKFHDITLIDISSLLTEALKQKLSKEVHILCQDFFTHEGQYDLILEQTFFCALHPSERRNYVKKMFDLLKPGGKLVGVLFNTEFEKEGPPFGGSLKEYETLFSEFFKINTLEVCHNSIKPRQGNEVFAILQKPENGK